MIRDNMQVWIGVAGVTPLARCELLSQDQGAYINFLTLATSEAEYRAKLAGALNYYDLQLFELLDVRPFLPADGSSDEILSIAQELEKEGNLLHVRYSTLHTFPRIM